MLTPHSCDDLTQRESQTTQSGCNYKSISCQNGSHGLGLKWRKDGEERLEPSWEDKLLLGVYHTVVAG